MKNFLTLLSCFILASCTSQPVAIEETGPVIYVSIASHNEEPSLKQPDYLADEELFWHYREGLVDFAQMLYDERVAYNWQSDWNFLKAILEYDTGTPETNGKNVALWMEEDLGFEISPHAHETEYNYADVAYLMEEVGVTPIGIVGGFLAAPVSDSKVDYLQEPIEGWIYDYTWEAFALWGGGTGLHKNEEGLWTSGIWRPESSENFFEDDPSALPNIGHYRSTWEGLYDLLEKRDNGELDPDQIYTITIMNDQKDFADDPNYVEEFRQQIEALSSYTEQGVIEWVSLSEVLEIWETEYQSEPNIFHYNEEASKSIFTKNAKKLY